jgi:diguanylate cyclase (GGDEF)-like protein/PAS domain S-box-containing protein
MEETLRENELRYRELFDNISSGVAIFEVKNDGNDFILKDFNKAGEQLDGDRKEDIVGKYIYQARPDSKEFGLLNVFKRVWKTGIPEHYPASFYEAERLKKWVENYVYKLPTGDIVAVYDDITDRKQAEEALRESENKYRELSIVDSLTQLYNSRYFYHQLKMEIDRADRYGHPLTLLLLDLDDFKQFNDAYGHIEGDQVLMRLGQVVKKSLRQTDSAYRYGGEEFTVLLPMTTGRDCVVTAERIRTEFKKETFSPATGQDFHVTVSIGLAQYTTKEDMKVFVHRVDQLMYTAKKNGKDRVCFSL